VIGFSRPVVLTPPAPIYNDAVGNLANTDAHDNCAKLTIDSKQECPIGPQLVGFDTTNQLSIRDMAARETLCAILSWPAEASVGDVIAIIAVKPRFVILDSEDGAFMGKSDSDMYGPDILVTDNDARTNARTHKLPVGYALPSCGLATSCFKYWRGTMKYRFQIVAFSSLEGQLRVSWDSLTFGDRIYNDREITVANDEGNVRMNTSYYHILDLAEPENHNFEVTIGYAQPTAFLPLGPKIGDPESVGFISPDHSAVYPSPWQNGTLRIDVVNHIVIANYNSVAVTGTDVNLDVLCYVSSPDIQVADFDEAAISLPSVHQMPFVLTTVPSDQVAVSRLQSTQIWFGPEEEPTTDTILKHFGEAVWSFNALFKRYMVHCAYGISNRKIAEVNMSKTHLTIIAPDFPQETYLEDPKPFDFQQLINNAPASGVTEKNSLATHQYAPHIVIFNGENYSDWRASNVSIIDDGEAVYMPDEFFKNAPGDKYVSQVGRVARSIPLNFISKAFIGRRGGLRHKYTVMCNGRARSSPDHDDDPTMMTVERAPMSTRFSIRATRYTDIKGAFFEASKQAGYTHLAPCTSTSRIANMSSGLAGSKTMIQSLNPVVSVELPFHNNYRYYSTRVENLDKDPIDSDIHLDEEEKAMHPLFSRARTGFHKLSVTNISAESYIVDKVSVAEDFTLVGFIGMPMLYNTHNNLIGVDYASHKDRLGREAMTSIVCLDSVCTDGAN